MALAKVEGILLNNENTRREMLKRIYWKDKQYTDFSNGEIVRAISVKTEEVSPIGEGRDLLTYTQNSGTDFNKETLKRYFSNGVRHDVFEIENVPDGERFRWLGDYLYNFEPNNTRYKVSQVKRAEGEKRQKIANDTRFREEKYLTPELLNFYGDELDFQAGVLNNIGNGLLDGIFQLATGRLDDFSETNNAKIVDDYSQKIGDIESYIKNKSYLKDGAGFRYLAEQINAVSKGKVKGKFDRYVEYESVNDSDDEDFSNYNNLRITPLRGILKNENDFNHRTFSAYKGKEIYKIYDEKDIARGGSESVHSVENESISEDYLTPNFKPKSLLSKTNALFNQHKIATMIGRFHTTLSDNGVDIAPNQTDSTITKYGNSHGRNLLAKETKETNGYDNPYCRVWTYHHQYDKVSKLIRPFNEDPRALNPYKTVYAKDDFSVDSDFSASDYLKKNTVLGNNGFVNIAPKADGNCVSSVEIKKCMFSIENLAWKDVPRKGVQNAEYYISDEQRGPNGGRIMWFPPYDLNFQESVSVNWNQNTFIGRGEPVFTYANTNRNGVLSFVILVDHPSIIDNIPKRNIKESILTEDDVLRFFAGCDLPSGFTADGACPETEIIPEQKKDSEEPVIVPNETVSKHLKFNVYFPNNYTGNGVKTPKNDWEINGSSDKLWYDYLLFGVDTEIPNIEGSRGIGYETGTSGISKRDTINGMDVVLVNHPWEEGTGLVKNVKYHYRVDFDVHQKLVNKQKDGSSRGMDYNISNYYDSKGYSLNVLLDNQKDDATHSFAQVVSSMVSADKTKFDVERNDLIATDTLLCNNIAALSQADEELVELFKNPDRITKITICGKATLQDSKNSSMLANRRSRSVAELIKKFVKTDVDIAITTARTEELVDKTAINTEDAKRQRSVSCEIWYDAPEITDVADTTSQIQSQSQRDTGSTSESNTAVKTETNKVYPSRYETESEYFYSIKKEDPLVYKKLIEKFKYFNPAFHSISPEGFNARLTFLQQCTRQGHTIEASNLTDFAKTAGNLAFGRMPVCVLRLGDFINTKMIINGMSINYDANGPMQWDLNPEGIGVQPMYAKVSLQVTILGGQSLEGPINRLQNAVTFNYYANTGVYDNRADIVEIENTVEKKEAGEGQVVSATREETRSDNSQYSSSIIKYRHVFTPSPKIDVTKHNNEEK